VTAFCCASASSPVCAVLEFPVSTYYAAKKGEREPSAREARDEQLKEQKAAALENPQP
jgi:hypothetical protein